MANKREISVLAAKVRNLKEHKTEWIIDDYTSTDNYASLLNRGSYTYDVCERIKLMLANPKRYCGFTNGDTWLILDLWDTDEVINCGVTALDEYYLIKPSDAPLIEPEMVDYDTALEILKRVMGNELLEFKVLEYL